MAKKSKKRCEELPILHPQGAGIDVGASQLFVAVSADRDTQPVPGSHLHSRSKCTCGLATAVRDSISGNGVNQAVLESLLSDGQD
jgi:hypothetical protein